MMIPADTKDATRPFPELAEQVKCLSDQYRDAMQLLGEIATILGIERNSDAIKRAGKLYDMMGPGRDGIEFEKLADKWIRQWAKLCGIKVPRRERCTHCGVAADAHGMIDHRDFCKRPLAELTK